MASLSDGSLMGCEGMLALQNELVDLLGSGREPLSDDQVIQFRRYEVYSVGTLRKYAVLRLRTKVEKAIREPWRVNVLKWNTTLQRWETY